jgi:hypothetical protein
MSIINNAMVLNLQIGIWQGYRLDKEASQKVTSDAGADNDAARVNKHLVPKEALKPVQTAATTVRLHFYTHTLPWKDNGDRLLTRLMFTDFIEEHERLVGQFRDAVDTFLSEAYPSARDQAEFRMGELFKAEDYPSADSLRHRFYVNMDIDPVTAANDFRVEMEQDQLDSVRKGMEQAMQERIGRAMADVWERVLEVVEKFADKTRTKDAVFRDSLVGNIEQLVDMLPGLNVLNDPDLDAIGKEVKARLLGYDLKDLRKKPAVRSAAAREAQEIMDKMAGFMTCFQQAAE